MTTQATSAQAVLDQLTRIKATIAVAESLTGGMVCSLLTDIPGASAVVRGAVVSYATDVKHSVLEVDDTLLAERGPVDSDVALAMAARVARVLGSRIGISTTGVAGPDRQNGIDVGTVFVAVNDSQTNKSRVLECHFSGNRAEIRRAAAGACLDLCGKFLSEIDEK